MSTPPEILLSGGIIISFNQPKEKHMGLIARMFEIKVRQAATALRGKPQRTDERLPLNIKIGSSIGFEQSSFIIGGDQLEFVPPVGRCLCRGYSTLSNQGNYSRQDGNYIRFYLQDESTPKRDFVLQVGSGQPTEIILYQPYLNPEACPDGEICPGTAEEWETWIGQNGLIGSRFFNIPSGTEYQRVIMPNDEKKFAPFDYVDKASFDAFLAPTKIADIAGMTCGRTIEVDGIEVKEFALPEKHEDKDGAFITVLIGVEMTVGEIDVL